MSEGADTHNSVVHGKLIDPAGVEIIRREAKAGVQPKGRPKG